MQTSMKLLLTAPPDQCRAALRFGMNFWQLFLILIPAEAVVYFSFNIRAKH